MWREGEKARATQLKSGHEPLGEVTKMDTVTPEKLPPAPRPHKVLQSSDVMNTYRSQPTQSATMTPTVHLMLSRTQHTCQRPLSVVVEKVSPKTLLGRCENMNTTSGMLSYHFRTISESICHRHKRHNATYKESDTSQRPFRDTFLPDAG